MPHYRVKLAGENIRLTMEGEVMKLGFLTTRLVEAQDEAQAEAQAELNAVKLIREDQKLAGVLNERSDPPMIYCEGIEEIEPFDPSSVVQLGFTFFPEEAQS
jgi:hypothetical protein